MMRNSDGNNTSRENAKKRGLKASISFAIAAWAATAGLPALASSQLLVKTKEGPVEGLINGGVAEFLGIPYAEPPVGDLRWRPPERHAPWTRVLKAQAFGPTCAQITPLINFAGPMNNNEDCLYLNVFTPGVDPRSKEKLPVIFWIHGGGNFDGESNDYEGSKMAAEGHTVVVTLNYRLGLLGWFAHPALDAEGHLFGNYGLLDQQLALSWVKANIDKFGGDKSNITVGGQSAGSVDTEAHMASPLSAGLFDRAIIQSTVYEPTPLGFAETLAANFSVAAGCGSGASREVAKCLRNLTAAQIMSLQGTTKAEGPYYTLSVADGKILPTGGFIAAFRRGQFNHVPVINGTTRDEANFFIAIAEYYSGPPQTARTAVDYENYVNSVYTGNSGPGGSPPTFPAGTVNKVLARYPLVAYATPQLAQDAVQTDSKVCQSRQFNQILSPQVPVYAYEFDDRTAPSYFPKLPGFQPLAYHTSDIQYLFPHYHGGPEGIPHDLNREQEILSRQLVAGWTNFAWTGDPNGIGNSPWPRFRNDPAKPSYLSQNIPTLSTFTDDQFSAAHKCDFWDKISGY